MNGVSRCVGSVPSTASCHHLTLAHHHLQDAIAWILAVTPEAASAIEDDLASALCDGVLLVHLLSVVTKREAQLIDSPSNLKVRCLLAAEHVGTTDRNHLLHDWP
jgi:hypothetical protein